MMSILSQLSYIFLRVDLFMFKLFLFNSADLKISSQIFYIRFKVDHICLAIIVKLISSFVTVKMIVLMLGFILVSVRVSLIGCCLRIFLVSTVALKAILFFELTILLSVIAHLVQLPRLEQSLMTPPGSFPKVQAIVSMKCWSK